MARRGIHALPETHRLLRQSCREFAERELRPGAAAADREHRFPADAVRGLAKLGLMGVAIEEENGGAGLDSLAYAVAMEEISRGCAIDRRHHEREQLALLRADAGVRHGAQKARWALASGEKLGCFALSEPGNGATPAPRARRRTATAATAAQRPQGVDHKRAQADAAIVFASTDRALKQRGISAFIVPKPTPGLAVGKRTSWHPRVVHVQPHLRQLPRAGRQPAGRRGRGSRSP